MVGLVIDDLRFVPRIIILLSDNAILLSNHLLVLRQVKLLLHDVLIPVLAAISISEAPGHVTDLPYGHPVICSNLDLHLI